MMNNSITFKHYKHLPRVWIKDIGYKLLITLFIAFMDRSGYHMANECGRSVVRFLDGLS